MDFQVFLRTRRSIRHFKPDSVPAPVIGRILDTATFAPSAHNLQPWRFAVIQTESAKIILGKTLTEKLRFDMNAEGASQADIDLRVNNSLRRIADAPVIILLCRDVTSVRKDEPEEHTMAMQSVALAGLQLMLSAYAEGLGANWICWPLYAKQAVRDALKLHDTWEPQGMFFIGYPDEEPGKKEIKPLNTIIEYL
jgi:coenzyme F420-0:L-glutamate ligase/coenzyme F420-1:gamma-L-glutamate ligase